MGIVGAASLYSGQGGASSVDPKKMVIGMGLIIVSQAVQAAQCTAEVRISLLHCASEPRSAPALVCDA